jgi:hypothetical protein
MRKLIVPVLLGFIIFISAPVAMAEQSDWPPMLLGQLLEGKNQGCSPKKSGAALQIFVNGNWKSVGKTTYVKNSPVCGVTSTGYGVNYKWEIDRLGEIDKSSNNGTVGTLQVRIKISGKSSTYFSVQVFQNQSAYDRYTNDKNWYSGRAFMCMIGGGQWVDAQKVCIGGAQPL